MTAHELGGLTIEVCAGCGGIWFGRNQLKTILDQGGPAVDELMGFEPHESHAAPHNSTFRCPDCKFPLHRNILRDAPGVFINTCYQCAGLYMEPEALAKLNELADAPSAAQSVLFSSQARATADALSRLDAANQRNADNMVVMIRQREMLRYGARGLWF
jgi:Zn-finger nucleic acid-binding protein